MCCVLARFVNNRKTHHVRPGARHRSFEEGGLGQKLVAQGQIRFLIAAYRAGGTWTFGGERGGVRGAHLKLLVFG